MSDEEIKAWCLIREDPIALAKEHDELTEVIEKHDSYIRRWYHGFLLAILLIITFAGWQFAMFHMKYAF